MKECINNKDIIFFGEKKKIVYIYTCCVYGVNDGEIVSSLSFKIMP